MAAGVTIVLRKLEQWDDRRLLSPRAAFPVTAARQASSRLSGLAKALPASASAGIAIEAKNEGMVKKIW